MTEVNTYRLFITPKTKVNISDNEKWMLSEKISEEYLLAIGKKKRAKQIEEGKDPKKAVKETCYVDRRRYMLTYFDYKRKVKELFLQCGLNEFPTNGVWFRFFIDMPVSWSKKKKNMMRFEPHESTPDASNFHKALEDSCSVADRKNWDYRATKFWNDTGFIEIEIGSLPKAIGYNKVIKPDVLK